MSASAWSTSAVPACSAARRRAATAAADSGSSYQVRILSFEARVRGPAAIVRAAQALRPCAPAWTTGPNAAVSTTFEIRPDTPRPGWRQLIRDNTVVDAGDALNDLLAALDTAITAAAVEALSHDYLLVHAGAVAYANRGLLLPAAASRGKSTLVAGLMAAGFHYLTDEVAVFDPHSRRLLPFAKSLAIKRGGASALARLYPKLASSVPRLRVGSEVVWYLPPPVAAWPRRPVPLRHVILPSYVPTARTELVRIPRTAALAQLVQQSCQLLAHGPAGFGSLVAALREADCYALTVSQLQAAVNQLLRLVHG